MVHLLIKHDVEHFKQWKTVFDEHASTRANAGSKGGHLFRNPDKPKEVVILMEWSSIHEAQTFVESPDLKEAMDRAGVVGEPEVTYLESVETFDV